MAAASAYPAYKLLTPQFHAGPALLLPLLAWMLLPRQGMKNAEMPWVLVACASFIIFLLSFSDRLAFLQIVVPLSAMAMFAVWRHPTSRRSELWILALVLTSGILGLGVDMIWRPDNPGAAVNPELSSWWSNSKEMWRLSNNLRVAAPVQLVVALAAILMAFLIAVLSMRRMPQWTYSNVRTALLAGFAVLYPPLMQFVHAGSSLEPVLHYRLFDLVLALVLFPVFAIYFVQRKCLGLLTKSSFIIVGLWFIYAGVTFPRDVSKANKSIQSLVKCLDDLNGSGQVAYGAGEYWDAVPINALSQSGITVISVNPDLTARPWNQKGRIDLGRTFDFLVLNAKFPFELGSKLRQPTRQVSCEERDILISAPANATP